MTSQKNMKIGRSKGIWVRVRQACFLAKITFFEDEFIVFSCHLRFHMYVTFYIFNINTREINGKANEKTIKIYDRLWAIKQKLFVTDQIDFRGCRCVFAFPRHLIPMYYPPKVKIWKAECLRINLVRDSMQD